jgi:flagellar M-ring protein FliF
VDPQTVLARLRSLSANFTTAQLVSLGVSFVLVVGVVGGSALWLSVPTYSPLFADMDPESAGQVIARLKTMKVPYAIDEGGRAIRVQSTRVDELRLDFTAQGLPSSGRIGFEIFDRTAFGATEFLEKINYRRALEGEIARTISSLAEVSTARVHIAMGKDTLFGEPRPAKASVVVKLRHSRGLSPASVIGIANLVSSSVEGLRPESVVILDSSGRPLSRPREDDEASTDGYVERQQRLEHDMASRVVALLEPVVGAGRVRVNVALKLDPRTRELTEERWDPNTAIRSRQTSTDVANSLAAGGIAGARANLPVPESNTPGAPAPSSTGSSRNSETTNYEVSRTTSRTVEPPGDVARMSVAVILDDSHEMKPDGEGRQVLARVPRSSEELQKLQGLVSASLGVDAERGDQVTVENVSFEDPLASDEPPPDFWTRYSAPLTEAMRALSVVLLGVAVLVLVVRPVLRKGGSLAPVPVAATPETQVLDRPRTVAELESQIEAEMDAAAAEKIGDTRRLPVLTRKAAALAQKEPQQAARLLRSWMADQER